MTRRRVTTATLSLAGAGLLAAGVAPLGASASTTLPAPPPGSSYVALGDSFSSGTGTRASTGECYRSPYGYPVLLAGRHGLDLSYQACSGAVSADVHRNQLGALSADTDYVTMTIGGNDIGFVDVITHCALPGWLSNCTGRVNQAREVLRTQMPARYDALLAEIGTRAPNAEVVVGSYPRLFNGRNCNLATFFSSSDMAQINAGVDELAALIQDRAAAAGAHHADPRAAFTGHAVCDSPEWVNGLSMPIGESYHPNRAGNVGYADVFWPGGAGVAGAADLSAVTGTDAFAAGDTDAADAVRAQADAILAMDLTSAANLRAARNEGVPTGEIQRLVRQLRSTDTAVVERALTGFRTMNEAHARRTEG